MAVNIESVEVKDGAYVLRDDELVEIAHKLAAAEEKERKIRRELNPVLDEIAALKLAYRQRVAELTEVKPLHKYPVRNRPDAEQIETLKVFESALELPSLDLLHGVHILAKKMKCHQTNWKSKNGETLDEAYERRCQELA